jgi:ABC-2 type transport system ATP-binding protein
MGDVKELCKRVIIIDKGKIVFDGELEEIVEKYADHKILSVVFSKEIDPRKLEEIGEIKEFDYPKAVISVKREAASVASAELLQHFPVADLNVEEVPIEQIIREVFTGQDTA